MVDSNDKKPLDNSDEFGDFQEVKEEGQEEIPQGEGEGIVRVRLPRGEREFIGVVVQRLGGNKMEIKCTDGKTRNSRVPGRFKRRFWLRPGDYVIVEVWELDDSKADIIHQYRKGPQVDKLKKMGKVEGLKEEF
ncbi:translation initiation factor IF-1A [Candidatus Pacearchaeota archaeon]|nr:translation initiation factor IF-1A [Candidatus Pacearchaeota archaeon]|tara:strand:- start:9225 stop:9626 length:402 start_codon:yes stop_codon:yes gene_type:complete